MLTEIVPHFSGFVKFSKSTQFPDLRVYLATTSSLCWSKYSTELQPQC